MRTATDTYTGRRFRYNETTWWPTQGLYAPARYTSRRSVELHPDRTDAATLIRLNPGLPRAQCRDCKLGATWIPDGRPEGGRWHGDRDVEPCPGGDDDFHHWEGP